MMPKVPPVQYSAMAPVHDDSNPSHSNPITSPQIFGWSVWGAFQLTEALPPAGTSHGIAGQTFGAALPNLWGALEQRKEKALL